MAPEFGVNFEVKIRRCVSGRGKNLVQQSLDHRVSVRPGHKSPNFERETMNKKNYSETLLGVTVLQDRRKVLTVIQQHLTRAQHRQETFSKSKDVL